MADIGYDSFSPSALPAFTAFKLSPPWILYHEKVKALFGQDPDIRIDFDEKARILTLRVDGIRKAEALTHIMPPEYGSVKVRVVPGNGNGGNADPLPENPTPETLLSAAFDGNPVIVQIRAVSKGLFRDLAYCVFEREVVQFPADNLGDINGNVSTLMEDIAREVLNVPGACFCTSAVTRADGKLGADYPYVGDAPLGMWP